MKELIIPQALKQGDTIAAITLSYGAAGRFPNRYQQGVRQIEAAFGVKVVPTPHALCSPEEIYTHPDWRLEDMMWAFKNPDIKGIICNIGGDDTIRLLDLMTDKHFDVIRNNPKVFLGISDSTVNHLMCFKAGLRSYYSASLLFGYAENGGIPDIMVQNTKKTLFETAPIGQLPHSDTFIVDHVDWGSTEQPARSRIPTQGPRFIQGNQTVRGRLIGGCTDVLMMMVVGTKLWPELDTFDNAVLFLENSEERPSPEYMLYWLRNLGAQGILKRINGLLFARPGNDKFVDETDKQNWLSTYPKFDEVILKVLKEYGRQDLPVVTNMDYGHTVPQLILPYGAMCEINPVAKKVSILESGVRERE